MTTDPKPTSTPPPLEPPLPEALDTKALFEGLLRRPQALAERLASKNEGAAGRFGFVALIAFLIFGFVIGCFAKYEQLWAAPAKISLGVMFAGIICFPSLYIFSTLAGAKVSIQQLAACLAGAMALAGLLLLGFAPAIWIFAESTNSYGFMGTLGIGSWIIAVLFSLKFLKSVIRSTGGTQQLPLFIWSVVFLLVTLQLTTSLRPILGRSDDLFTQEKKFFLQHWSENIGETLPVPVKNKDPKTQPSDD